jgi:hypothetical protein
MTQVREYFRFHQDKASSPFDMVIEEAGLNGGFTFYREEKDGEVWNVKTFAYLSEAFAYFAQQLKECGR